MVGNVTIGRGVERQNASRVSNEHVPVGAVPISRSWSSASAEGLCLNVRLRQSVVRGRTSPVMHFRCGDSSKKRFSRPYESGDQMKGLSSGATQIVRRIARKTSRGAEYE
jgi:hypothetical protein